MRRSLAIACWLGALMGACAAPRDARHDDDDDAALAPPAAIAAPAPCAECHVDHAREHDASAHARAFTSPLFQREWRQRPSPFCARCHAPRAHDPEAEPELARAGVDCESCHGTGGAVRAVRVSGDAPHASVVDPTLATTEACAGCHQVDFPEIPGQPLQDTVAEWRDAGEPGGSCQSCHVPLVGSRHRHHLPGGHQLSMLRDALTITARAERDGWDTRVVLRLEATGAGHAVPTGDVFRRLTLRAWRDDRPDDTPSIVELGRHFEARDGRPWVPTTDDRVFPAGGAREVTLRVRGRPSHVRWSAEMWSLPQSDAAHADLPEQSLRRPFASGTLPVPPWRGL